MLHDTSECSKVKIEAIFSDYDGTLSPLEVSREETSIPASLFSLLKKVSSRIPLAVITTKDLRFVKEKVPFASATATICGLELQTRNTRFLDQRALKKTAIVDKAYNESLRIAKMLDNLIIERKISSDGDLFAFCVDWRMSRNWMNAQRIISPFLYRCRELGLYVVESDANPFADVYPIKVDKGTALARVKNELGLNGPIMYLGDSEFDNPAFKLADISIGIVHKEMNPNLLSRYQMEFSKLETFFSRLLTANFDFRTSMLS
ncbi:MAG: HAD-IIB family hydrolase [Thaumarchaeota archaeon]|nr:HAD-IIB family hydrolase [Nitrososphaerota archaeon]